MERSWWCFALPLNHKISSPQWRGPFLTWLALEGQQHERQMPGDLSPDAAKLPSTWRDGVSQLCLVVKWFPMGGSWSYLQWWEVPLGWLTIKNTQHSASKNVGCRNRVPVDDSWWLMIYLKRVIHRCLPVSLRPLWIRHEKLVTGASLR